MLFNSLAFAIFLPIVFILYWSVPHKFRWIILLVSSYYFYMSWNVKYVVLILFTTAVSYAAALLLPKFQSIKVKKLILLMAITASLLVLFVFKYFNFAFATLSRVCEMVSIPLHPITLKLLLPVGISFYTFQSFSYVIDVYRGEVEQEENFFKYAAFISFFPQLVAGPIERTRNLLPQIDKEHVFSYEKASYGIKLMAWGFFKKLVLADNLAIFVDMIFEEPTEYSGFAFTLAILFFSIQIYCDFSGYSDIAIGCAKLFDIDLMTNFSSPYFSGSIQEFWRRWHISLSTWFRDYVYIPLGGSRKGKIRHYVNLIITFFISGLWHGAAVSYIVWGGLHGVFQAVENFFFGKNLKAEAKSGKEEHGLVWWIRVMVVFIFLNFTWCFFRAASCKQALWILYHSFDGIKQPLQFVKAGFDVFDTHGLKLMIAPILLLGVFDYFALKKDPIQVISGLRKPVRNAIYVGFFFFVMLFACFGSQEFVYFQF